jgi:hypothetical protein
MRPRETPPQVADWLKARGWQQDEEGWWYEGGVGWGRTYHEARQIQKAMEHGARRAAEEGR